MCSEKERQSDLEVTGVLVKWVVAEVHQAGDLNGDLDVKGDLLGSWNPEASHLIEDVVFLEFLQGRGLGDKELECNFFKEPDSLIHCGLFAHFMLRFKKTTADIKRKWRDSGNEITKRIYSIFLINAQPVVRIFRGLVSKVASVFPRPRCSRWLDQSGLRSTLGFAGEKKLCLRISVRISFFIRFIWSKSTVENDLGPKTFYLIFGHLVNHQPVLCPWHCEVHRNLKKEWFCMILTLWCTTITNALVYIWPPTRPPWVKAWYISLAKNTSQPITPLWSYCKKHVALYWPQVKPVPGGGRFLPEAIVLSISLPNKIERKRSENL